MLTQNDEKLIQIDKSLSQNDKTLTHTDKTVPMQFPVIISQELFWQLAGQSCEQFGPYVPAVQSDIEKNKHNFGTHDTHFHNKYWAIWEYVLRVLLKVPPLSEGRTESFLCCIYATSFVFFPNVTFNIRRTCTYKSRNFNYAVACSGRTKTYIVEA